VSEVDRPGGDDSAGGASPRLRLFRGGARGGAPRPPSPAVVARRLALLERRVEDALAGGAMGREVLLPVLDEAMRLVAGLRRVGLGDLREAFDLSSPRATHAADALLRGLYRRWWRVEVTGIERVPAAGQVVLVVNRGGSLVPWETLMIARALREAHPAPRLARPLVDPWLAGAALARPLVAASGALPWSAGVLRRVLARDEAAVLLPEGDAALAKPFGRRYRLARFSRPAFARAAIATGALIVPVAVIGAEEVHPVLARSTYLGRLLGLPTLPVTPTFPWLGLAGLLPLPTKWRLHFGEPLDVAARFAPTAAADTRAVGGLVEQVRERLQGLVVEGLRQRRSIFGGS
jgi:1-acyl-sn-glycerol-3-phosphate acyltransferase